MDQTRESFLEDRINKKECRNKNKLAAEGKQMDSGPERADVPRATKAMALWVNSRGKRDNLSDMHISVAMQPGNRLCAFT